MEDFTNHELTISDLPKFESVVLQRLHQKYRNIVAINIGIVFLFIVIIELVLLVKLDEVALTELFYIVSAGVLIGLLISSFLFWSFRKKGYAFREKDLIYQYGVVATNTKIIPYNRIQHVALHEGLISRYLGLAQVEIYTAGVQGGDIKIPGVLKDDAERIKQLLMGKIQKEL